MEDSLDRLLLVESTTFARRFLCYVCCCSTPKLGALERWGFGSAERSRSLWRKSTPTQPSPRASCSAVYEV